MIDGHLGRLDTFIVSTVCVFSVDLVEIYASVCSSLFIIVMHCFSAYRKRKSRAHIYFIFQYQMLIDRVLENAAKYSRIGCNLPRCGTLFSLLPFQFGRRLDRIEAQAETWHFFYSYRIHVTISTIIIPTYNFCDMYQLRIHKCIVQTKTENDHLQR